MCFDWHNCLTHDMTVLQQEEIFWLDRIYFIFHYTVELQVLIQKYSALVSSLTRPLNTTNTDEGFN